jgi:succinoglycan biosynthesis protein ExoA
VPELDPALTTLVVPARNEEGHIDHCLRALRSQTESRLQILVVDGASTDRTREIVSDHAAEDPRVELIDNPERIVPTGLNRALAAARGAWLVRVDAHATVPADYVRTAVELLRTGRWGGVGGRKDGVGVTPAGKAVAAAMGSRFGVGNSTYHHGTAQQVVNHIPFGAYPTALARSLGGWDERLAVNQDYEFDHRVREAGHELLFEPSLAIQWHCRQSVRALFQQYRRYGRGKIDVLRLHPESALPRQLAPAALVAGWLVAAALSRRKPWLAVLAFGPYAAALAGATVSAAGELDDPAARVHLPGAFLALHVGWGVGLWEGLFAHLTGRRRL